MGTVESRARLDLVVRSRKIQMLLTMVIILYGVVSGAWPWSE